ncbi:MAG: GTP 3',8-cyclase MoaA, partial [Gammaproteobacteria bacterium]
RNYLIAENGLNIGFITPISQHFCASCNRVRLTADGQMHMCLGQEHRYDFARLLRGGIDDATLVDHILAAIALKPERHEFRERPEQVLRFMSQTGG